jgi:hypothetical protein
VIGVEDASRFGNFDAIRLGRFPGQLDQPVEIGAHHRILGRTVGHALQALQLLVRLRRHLLGHPGVGDGLAQRLDLDAVAGFALAQFLLDRLQLLAQQVFALPLVHAGLGALVELARKAQHLEATEQAVEHDVQPAQSGQPSRERAADRSA